VGFGIGVIGAGVRARVSFGDAEVSEEKGDGMRAHGGAAIGMDGEFPRADVLFAGSGVDQAFGEFSAFAAGDHPPDDKTAEDIEDDVEIEVGPFGRAMEFSEIPRPELVGSGGEEFRFGVGGMAELVAPFTELVLLVKDAVHGPLGTEIGALIKERGVDL